MSRNLLEESRLKQERFCDSSKGRWEERDFQRFPQQIMNVIKGKAGLSVYRSFRFSQPWWHQAEQLKRFGMTATAIYFGGSKNREMDGWFDIGVEA